MMSSYSTRLVMEATISLCTCPQQSCISLACFNCTLSLLLLCTLVSYTVLCIRNRNFYQISTYCTVHSLYRYSAEDDVRMRVQVVLMAIGRSRLGSLSFEIRYHARPYECSHERKERPRSKREIKRAHNAPIRFISSTGRLRFINFHLFTERHDLP